MPEGWRWDVTQDDDEALAWVAATCGSRQGGRRSP
jgi:hypothetical protein